MTSLFGVIVPSSEKYILVLSMPQSHVLPGVAYFPSLVLVLSLVQWETCISWSLRPLPVLTSYISMIQSFELEPTSIQKAYADVWILFIRPLCLHEWIYWKFTIWGNELYAVSNPESLFTFIKCRHSQSSSSSRKCEHNLISGYNPGYSRWVPSQPYFPNHLIYSFGYLLLFCSVLGSEVSKIMPLPKMFIS